MFNKCIRQLFFLFFKSRWAQHIQTTKKHQTACNADLFSRNTNISKTPTNKCLHNVAPSEYKTGYKMFICQSLTESQLRKNTTIEPAIVNQEKLELHTEDKISCIIFVHCTNCCTIKHNDRTGNYQLG